MTGLRTVGGKLPQLGSVQPQVLSADGVTWRTPAEYLSTTNLIHAPSFEESTPWTQRTNLANNPSAENATGGYNMTPGVGATATLSRPTTGGAVGSAHARMTWTAGNTGTTGSGIYYYAGTPDGAVTPTRLYTGSLYVRCSKTQIIKPFLQWRDSTGAVVGSLAYGTAVTVPANTWTRMSATGTAPTGAVKISLYAFTDTGASLWQVGDTLDLDGVLIEQAPDMRPYFDGATAASGELSYLWSGTANASPSYERRPGGTKWGWNAGGGDFPQAYRVTDPQTGTYALELSTTGSLSYLQLFATIDADQIISGRTYTLSFWAKSMTGSTILAQSEVVQNNGTTPASNRQNNTVTTAWQRYTHTFTALLSGTGLPLVARVILPLSAVVTMRTDGWMLHEGAAAILYFDGSNTADADYVYTWTEMPHQSPSVKVPSYERALITNLVKNPSTETNATSVNKIGSSTSTAIARDTTRSVVGTSSVGVDITAGTQTNVGLNWVFNADISAPGLIRWSCWAYSSVATTVRGYAEGSILATGLYAGFSSVEAGVSIPANVWQQVIGTLTVPSDRKVNRVGFLLSGTPVTGQIVRGDACLCVAGSNLPDYFDGDTTDDDHFVYGWTGTPHGSTSIRRPVA